MKKIFKFIPAISSLGLLAPSVITVLSTSCSNVSYNIKEMSVVDSEGNEETKTNILYKKNSSIPYISLEDGFNLLKVVHKNYAFDSKFNFSITRDGFNYIVKRENGSTLKANPTYGSLTFDDFSLFICEGGNKPNSVMRDYGELEKYDSTNVHYVALGEEDYRVKTQISRVLYLSDYGIEFIEYKNKLYLPFQTLSDLFLTDLYRPMTVLKDVIYSPFDFYFKKGVVNTYPEWVLNNKLTITKELLEFNYKETCFFLDSFYCFNQEKEYTNFDTIFEANGWKNKMLSSLEEYEDTMDYFISTVLDDGHSNIYNWTPSTKRTGAFSVKVGPSELKRIEKAKKYYQLRKNNLTEEQNKKYLEMNDTAVIMFDSFDCNDKIDYYQPGTLVEDPNNAQYATDLFFSAYKKISNNNNIKNVVVDITFNPGGDVRTCLIIAGMLAGGEVCGTFKHTLDQSINSCGFYVDANLDHKIDQNDFVLKNKNVYILTSNFSFSCGNFLPTILFQQPNCHVIGKRSGGGAGLVLPTSNILSQGYQISGPIKLGYFRSGIFQDNENGIEPEFDVPESIFYKRDQLIDYIKSH